MSRVPDTLTGVAVHYWSMTCHCHRILIVSSMSEVKLSISAITNDPIFRSSRHFDMVLQCITEAWPVIVIVIIIGTSMSEVKFSISAVTNDPIFRSPRHFDVVLQCITEAWPVNVIIFS